ncbi:CRAL-TRIO domain-containing protein [Tanacetum coccineum]|uniref:CRAL-TRIO domain-containing protein n=1 Tax=Tanacetum coccineum TaxID=301880 RepID=A0ABQ5FKA8_9ASTR
MLIVLRVSPFEAIAKISLSVSDFPKEYFSSDICLPSFSLSDLVALVWCFSVVFHHVETDGSVFDLSEVLESESSGWENCEKSQRKLFMTVIGRSILIMKPGLQITASLDSQIKQLVYTIENAILNLPQGQEEIVWLLDFIGLSFRINVPIKTARDSKTAGVVAFIRRATPLQMVCDMKRTRQQVLYDGKAGDARYPLLKCYVCLLIHELTNDRLKRSSVRSSVGGLIDADYLGSSHPIY